MSIIAKYPSKCSACGQPVTPGQKIEWVKGQPVRHTVCGAPQAQAIDPTKPGWARAYRASTGTAQRRRGTWTGCSCGSVEEYSRPSDCASCQYDA